MPLLRRPLVEDVPEGVHINFLRAERSLHRWAQEDVQRIHDAELTASTEGAGVEMHVLEDAGHWVRRRAVLDFIGGPGPQALIISSTLLKKHCGFSGAHGQPGWFVQDTFAFTWGKKIVT